MTENKEKTRRKYDEEFKQEAVRLVLEGRPATEVAADLGIGANLLYRWKAKALDEGSHCHAAPSPVALRATPEQIQQLHEIHAQLKAETESNVAADLDVQFHRHIAYSQHPG